MALTEAQRKEKKALEGKKYRGTMTAAETKRLDQLRGLARPGRPRKEVPRAPDPITPPPSAQAAQDAPKASNGPDDLPGVDMNTPPPAPEPVTVNPKRAGLIQMLAGGVTGFMRAANASVFDHGGICLPKDGPIHDHFFGEVQEAWTRIFEKRIPTTAGSEELDEWFVGGTAVTLCGQAAYFQFRSTKKQARPAPPPPVETKSDAPPPPPPPPMEVYEEREGEKPVRAGSLGALVTVSPLA